MLGYQAYCEGLDWFDETLETRVLGICVRSAGLSSIYKGSRSSEAN